MPVQARDLWGLVRGKPHIDPDDLAEAVEGQVADGGELDYRTRLLIRDSVEALRGYWGERRLGEWLTARPARGRIEAICAERFERTGFPSIRERLMEKTDPATIEQLFRELGSRMHHRTRLAVGGSVALIMPGYLERATEDIDVVDEVPAEIRSQHALLDELRK